MDRAKQRAIASQGGKTAHQKGTAHQWTSETARAAGRLGGQRSAARKAAARGNDMGLGFPVTEAALTEAEPPLPFEDEADEDLVSQTP